MTTREVSKRTSDKEANGPAKKAKQSSLLTHFAKIKTNSETSINSSPVKQAVMADKNALIPIDDGGSIMNDPNLAISTTIDNTISKSSKDVTVKESISFTEEDRKILKLELQQLDGSWLSYLKSELVKPYFRQLKAFVAEEQQRGITTYPPNDLVYSWARLCPFETVRVVIIGQDPYHNYRQAMGLCFSVPKDVIIPPSLINIYKELSNDIPGFKPPNHGDLTLWAQQGVLLLNTSLTVRAHEPASHAGKGWEQFTDAVIRVVNVYRKNVVFILWGNHAQRKAATIDKSKHLVLKGVHPSPLSASRGFFGCKHFSRTNEYLATHGLRPIDWQLPPK